MEATLLKALRIDELQELSLRFKKSLVELYGDSLDSLVLFGSYARGDFRADSDVDFLVVLNQITVQFGVEVDKISLPASQLGLDYTVHISAKPVTATSYYQSDSLFYEVVRREGVTI